MSISKIQSFNRKVVFFEHGYKRETAVVLVGVYRCLLLVCVLGVLGFATYQGLLSFDCLGSPPSKVELWLYPVLGLFSSLLIISATMLTKLIVDILLIFLAFTGAVGEK
ncbi:hypothetical protein [Serratia proteamaculans]